MTPTVGIFDSQAAATRAVDHLRAAGVTASQIHVFTPGTPETALSRIPTGEAEQPGMGKAMGGVIGGAVGAAGGAEIGAIAAASVLMPVAAPAIAVGLVGAVLLSLGGAAVGGALENTLEPGLPKDEVFVYEDALLKGFSILVVATADAVEREKAVRTLEASSATSIDAARERWWIGLRDTESFEYRAEGLDFQRDEPTYRQGFEAALSLAARGKAYQDAVDYLANRYPESYRDAAFRRGYDRGRAHYRRLRDGRRPPRRAI